MYACFFIFSINLWFFSHKNGSNTDMATLDISKTSDKVNHFKLYSSLIKAGTLIVRYLWIDTVNLVLPWGGTLNCLHGLLLNSCWNSAYRKIFGFKKWDSIKSFIQGLDFLDFKHIFMWMKLKLIKCLYLCNNSAIAAVRTLCVNSKEVYDLHNILSVKISSSSSNIRTAIYKHFEYICL